MKKIFKVVKKYFGQFILIFILLVLQVQCDLKLPEYTASIINIGIQQKGIEDGVPEAIRKNQFDLLLTFVNSNDTVKIMNSYYLSEGNCTENDMGLVCPDSIYPEPVFILNDIPKEQREKLNDLLFSPLIIINFLTSNNPEMVNMRNSMLPSEMANIDMLNFIPMMSEEQITEIITKFDENLINFEPMLLKQMSIKMVESEYVALNINLGKMQNDYLINTGLKMIGIAFAAMTLMIIIAYITSKVGAGISRDLRSEVSKSVMSFSNQEFEKFGTSSLITRSTNDITQIQMLIVMALRIILYSPMLGLGALAKVSGTQMSWVIGVAVLVILTLVVTLLIIALPKFQSLQKLIDKVNLVSREILTGLPVIRAFATEKKEEKRFDKANIDLTKTNLFVNRVMAIMFPTMMFIMNGVSVLIIWVGAKYVDLGTMQVGTLMAFITYAMQIIMSFLMLTMISIMLPRALISIKRVGEIFSCPLSIKEKEKTIEFPKEGNGTIEFKDVYFRYHDANEDVLENINFTALGGKTTAFIGSTGSGKSTLINLIPRFFDITSGKILIDGVDIRDASLKDLRHTLGFVPQKGTLFTGTIESNITFGDETIGKKEIQKAAEIAQGISFINEFDDKFAHEIAEGGTNVSGGQKQRLAIARAIAKNPKILIFDDSFSALDYKTDKRLRSALQKELQGKTVLIVASRIATIMDAHQIVVLDKGNIVGIGTHKELLENNEIYKEIAYSQLSEEELGYVK